MIKLGPAHILSGILLLVLQIILFKNVQVGVLDRFVVSIFVYPLIIITFPLGLPRSLLMTIAFFIGLCIDLFYDSPGVHTAALVLMAFSRSYILGFIEPRGGYGNEDSPSISKYGNNTILSFCVSYILILLYSIIVRL